MKYLWLVIWVITLCAGALFYSLAPSDMWYIIGFTNGCLSMVLLQLHDITSKRED